MERDKRTYARVEVRSSTLGSWRWHDRARDQKSKLALAQIQGVRQCSQAGSGRAQQTQQTQFQSQQLKEFQEVTLRNWERRKLLFIEFPLCARHFI